MKKKSSVKATHSYILTINGGSSSIKFAVYQTNEPMKRLLYGNIDRIGLPDSKLTFTNEKENKKDTLKIKTSDHRSASDFLIDWLEKQIDFSLITGIGHRVVHGMHHTSPEIITPELLDELARVAGPEASNGRLIIAHLGSGASMAAVKDGKSIDTSMGFTPASGIIMGTRPGDLDPGVAWYIIKSEQLTPKQFNNLINHESGLLGISETSSDMHDLLASEKEDIRAEEAITLFCYQAKKRIGAFAAALGGLDTLVFAGGIGENAPVIRSRICEGLGFLGIELDEKQNEANNPVISAIKGKTVVRVIHTDEEKMIAKTVSQMINISQLKKGICLL